MTPVMMSLYRLRLLGWLVRYLREYVLPSVRPPPPRERLSREVPVLAKAREMGIL
jgi:hypothetical protein